MKTTRERHFLRRDAEEALPAPARSRFRFSVRKYT